MQRDLRLQARQNRSGFRSRYAVFGPERTVRVAGQKALIDADAQRVAEHLKICGIREHWLPCRRLHALLVPVDDKLLRSVRARIDTV